MTDVNTADLPNEYRELQSVVRQFANEVVDPVAYEHDRNHTFPYDVVKQMGEMGLFGLPFSEEYGGMGGDYLSLGIALGLILLSVSLLVNVAISLLQRRLSR